ncbi:MAG: OmpA family protein [Bacteroidota bacterium]
MYKYKSIAVILVFTIIFSIKQQSQNLVKNPGFEETNKLENIWMRSVKQFNNSVIGWTSPTTTVPDLISLMVQENFWANPHFRLQSGGKQLPRTGNNMIGMRTYGIGDDGAVACWHEYIQTKLTEPLLPDNTYYVEFWVADAVRGINSSNNIGVLFTDSMIFTNDRLSLVITPHINECKLIESIEWYKISGFYKPDSIKNYMIIGNFYHDTQTKSVQSDGTIHGGYYYIDDVLVRLKLEDDKETSCKLEPVIIPSEKAPVEVDKPTVSTSEKNIDEISYNIGETIKLDNIFFETDKSVLLPNSLTELDKLVEILVKNPNLKLEINGHTDNVGTPEYNQDLSENRSKAVKDYLKSKNISENRLSHKGYGSSKPIATNQNEEGRSQNRRVEIKVISK